MKTVFSGVGSGGLYVGGVDILGGCGALGQFAGGGIFFWGRKWVKGNLHSDSKLTVKCWK